MGDVQTIRRVITEQPGLNRKQIAAETGLDYGFVYYLANKHLRRDFWQDASDRWWPDGHKGEELIKVENQSVEPKEPVSASSPVVNAAKIASDRSWLIWLAALTTVFIAVCFTNRTPSRSGPMRDPYEGLPARRHGGVPVRGHYRDGSYIKPHYRTREDGFRENNWSSKGNINPYTGRVGSH